MNEQEARQLLERYAQGLCSPEEKALIENWYQQEASGQILPDAGADADRNKNEIWQAVLETTGVMKERRRHPVIWKMAAAASLLLVVATAAYFYAGRQPGQQKQTAKSIRQEILPGGNKATLTLANGAKIILDDADGIIAVQSGIRVKKSKDGMIVYEGGQQIKEGEKPVPQKIETPKGGQYQVELADGTRVWLNAASDLRFPSLFTGNSRIVELSGEAYFEVAKNRKMPFIVRAKGTEVLVTGTHFNVMAYEDESQSATTLLEGAVQVSNQSEKVFLAPGQQAVNSNSSQRKLVKNEVDVETAVAWKNGLFKFVDADIETVMRQLSRWYNVSVVYKGAIPANRFGGYISRNSDLSQVLKMLALSGIKFSVEGKTINVL